MKSPAQRALSAYQSIINEVDKMVGPVSFTDASVMSIPVEAWNLLHDWRKIRELIEEAAKEDHTAPKPCESAMWEDTRTLRFCRGVAGHSGNHSF